jgi:hypothetical protein
MPKLPHLSCMGRRVHGHGSSSRRPRSPRIHHAPPDRWGAQQSRAARARTLKPSVDLYGSDQPERERPACHAWAGGAGARAGPPPRYKAGPPVRAPPQCNGTHRQSPLLASPRLAAKAPRLFSGCATRRRRLGSE